MAKYSIRLKQGETFELVFFWREPLKDLFTDDLILDEDGKFIPSTPINLSGYTARMHIRKNVKATSTFLELATSGAGITIPAPTAQIKSWVRAASTAAVTLSGPQTVDGVSVVAGDRVLVKAQALSEDNGIYDVKTGSWSRATDADAFGELNNAVVWVYEGTKNKRSQWKQTATLTGLSDPQIWVKDDQVGRVNVEMSAAQTATIPSSGVYDLELVSGAGKVTRVLEGKIRWSAEVTR